MKVILGVDPIKFPLTGVGRYTYELARALQAEQDVEQLRYLRGATVETVLPQAGEAAGRWQWIKPILARQPLAVAAYRYLGSLQKQRSLQPFSDHLFHGPNFYLPPFAGRSVATIHDLSVYSWASCHPPERVRYMRREIELTLRRASVLIVDSEFTRQEVSSFFSWPEKRVVTASLSPSSEFYPRSFESIAPQLSQYGLQADNYSLFIGTVEPRKNIEGLLDAYERLPQKVQKRWPLVISGYKGWENGALLERIKAMQSRGRVRYLGFVPAAHLPALYAGARLFVFPSHYEGFGLPIVEAMASGVPVVCSNASSLPEVAGDAAALCAPGDNDALLQKISRGLEDEDWRQAAKLKGLEQAAHFSWRRCANATVAAYRLAMDS